MGKKSVKKKTKKKHGGSLNRYYALQKYEAFDQEKNQSRHARFCMDEKRIARNKNCIYRIYCAKSALTVACFLPFASRYMSRCESPFSQMQITERVTRAGEIKLYFWRLLDINKTPRLDFLFLPWYNHAPLFRRDINITRLIIRGLFVSVLC